MATTNQAFIKVYRHDAAEPTPPARATAAARPAALTAAASIEYVSNVAACDSSTSPATANDSPLTGSIDVLGPPAQIAVDTTASSQTPPRQLTAKSASRRGEPRAWRREPPTAGKRPLSTFLARPRMGSIAPSDAGVQGILRPGTTVASFRWPTVCRVLSRKRGDDLDRVARLVSQQSHRGNVFVGILGLFPAGGCTTIALSLAERLADREHGTILVDGNFCRPRLAAWLDATPTAGWQDVLAQKAPLAEAIVHATDDHLDLLALSPGLNGDPAELVSRPQTTDCAALLREAYGFGLVDLGAFFDARSRVVALELVRRMEIGAAVAVAGPSPTDFRDLTALAEHLERSGCELLGVIENRAAQPPAANPAFQSSGT